MDERGNAYKILVVKPERKKLLGRLRRRWDDNIRTYCRERGWKGVDWIHPALVRTVKKPSDSIKGGEFLE
jgi:hypothetical protein